MNNYETPDIWFFQRLKYDNADCVKLHKRMFDDFYCKTRYTTNPFHIYLAVYCITGRAPWEFNPGINWDKKYQMVFTESAIEHTEEYLEKYKHYLL